MQAACRALAVLIGWSTHQGEQNCEPASFAKRPAGQAGHDSVAASWGVPPSLVAVPGAQDVHLAAPAAE